MAERTIRGDYIVKGRDNQYYLNPKTTGQVREGNIFLPASGATDFQIKVELELDENQYNQLKNDERYRNYLVPIEDAGKFAIEAATISSETGQILESPFSSGTDPTSREILGVIAGSSSELRNSMTTAFEVNGLSQPRDAVEPGNTSAANPFTPGTGTTPLVGSGTPVGGVTRGQATLTDTKVIRPQNTYRVLTYPSDMDDKQDKIRFTIYKSKKSPGQSSLEVIRALQSSSLTSRKDEDNYVRVGEEEVYLPITRISDTNAVDWSPDTFNPLQMKMAEISLEAMQAVTESTPNSNNAGASLWQLIEGFGNDSAMQNMTRLFLASRAVSANGLFTRATGGIFNPNLELLFNSPQLRSFAFSVGMISKNDKDATNVKAIINFFKKYMAARVYPANNMFLQSPYVFKIEYLAEMKEHPSLNKIRMCALQTCNVDYTPMGSYMTFNDESKTMFMYAMQLQFKELHPIYDVDYGNVDGDGVITSNHPIGY